MRKITLVSTLFLAVLYSCKKLADHETTFWVSNESNKNIFFGVSLNYPDTSLPAERMRILELNPGEEVPASLPKRELLDVFAGLPADTLSVFIFSADTINKYSWDSIRTRYNILKRYDLSYDDLRKNKFTVTYL